MQRMDVESGGGAAERESDVKVFDGRSLWSRFVVRVQAQPRRAGLAVVGLCSVILIAVLASSQAENRLPGSGLQFNPDLEGEALNFIALGDWGEFPCSVKLVTCGLRNTLGFEDSHEVRPGRASEI